MATKGTGTIVTFTDSNFEAFLMDVSGGVTRESLDNSHMGTTVAREFGPGALYDGGERTLTLQYDVDDTPPITGDLETVTIAYAGTGNVSFQAFVTGFDITASLEENMQATMTIKVSGEVNWS